MRNAALAPVRGNPVSCAETDDLGANLRNSNRPVDDRQCLGGRPSAYSNITPASLHRCGNLDAGEVEQCGRNVDVERHLIPPPPTLLGFEARVVDDEWQADRLLVHEPLAGQPVLAEVIGDTKGDKVDIFKYKNKTGYRRRMGHRQTYTTIKVMEIKMPKPKKAAKAKASEAEEK